MRFLQIHSFYDNYLYRFYKDRPQLEKATFKNHIIELVSDGFSANHMIAPYIKELGYESKLVVANSWPAQSQWAKENGLNIYNNEDWQIIIAKKQIEVFKPDVLYLSYPYKFESCFIRSLSWKASLILGWCGFCTSQVVDWSEFDIILSNLSECHKKSLELGAKYVDYFFPGFPTFITEIIKNEPKKFDVVFSGQCTTVHSKRTEYLNEVAVNSIKPDNEYSLGCFVPTTKNLPQIIDKINFGARWGVDMYKVLKAGKIVLNVDIDIHPVSSGNMRLFEATGTGSFLLTDYKSNLSAYFEPGVEIETFKDKNELIEKIYYYLQNEDEREAVARRGQRRCLSDYSMNNRAKAFDSIIRKYFLK